MLSGPRQSGARYATGNAPVSAGVHKDALAVHLTSHPLAVVHGPVAVPVAASAITQTGFSLTAA